jgi:hypothetical protein
MRSHRLLLALVIAIASLVLGIGTTAILGATRFFTRQGPATANVPYSTSPGVWGPGMMGPGMGRYPATHPPAPPRHCPGRWLMSPSPTWAA